MKSHPKAFEPAANDTGDPEELTGGDLLALLLRRRWVFSALIGVCMLAGVLIALTTTKPHYASEIPIEMYSEPGDSMREQDKINKALVVLFSSRTYATLFAKTYFDGLDQIVESAKNPDEKAVASKAREFFLSHFEASSSRQDQSRVNEFANYLMFRMPTYISSEIRTPQSNFLFVLKANTRNAWTLHVRLPSKEIYRPVVEAAAMALNIVVGKYNHDETEANARQLSVRALAARNSFEAVRSGYITGKAAALEAQTELFARANDIANRIKEVETRAATPRQKNGDPAARGGQERSSFYDGLVGVELGGQKDVIKELNLLNRVQRLVDAEALDPANIEQLKEQVEAIGSEQRSLRFQSLSEDVAFLAGQQAYAALLQARLTMPEPIEYKLPEARFSHQIVRGRYALNRVDVGVNYAWTFVAFSAIAGAVLGIIVTIAEFLFRRMASRVRRSKFYAF